MYGAIFLLAGTVLRFRSPCWKTAAVMWLYVLCTLVLWCLLMFDAGATDIHQGTYLTVLLAFSGTVLAIWAVSPRFAALLAALQIGFTILVYGFFCRNSQPAGTPQQPANWEMAVLAILAAALVCTVLVKIARFKSRDVPGALSSDSFI